jgi:hypothetical protein
MTLEEAIQQWVGELETSWADHYKAHFTNLEPPKVELDRGPKYVRMWRVTVGIGSRSAFAFIDKEGNIWKPAGWKGPTKNFPRGNVFGKKPLPLYGL